MNVKQIASGSTGNCYLITADNGHKIMIDCGIPWAKILEALDYKLQDIEGCFSDHCHFDHCKSLADVRKAGIDVYANESTLEAVGITGRRVTAIKNKDLVRLDTFQVFCFDLKHDEPNLGFIVYADGQYLLFCTDTAFISQRFKHPFSIIMIECSYDSKVLQQRRDNDDICEALATRLLTSHMELQQTKRYIKDFCDLSLCTEIHLLHLSGSNIDAEKARSEIKREFRIDTFIV